MPHEPQPSQPPQTRRTWLVAVGLLLLGGSVIWFWNSDIVLFPKPQTATVVVLDNCDDDFKTPPFDDKLLAFGPNGTLRSLATNLNHCQTVGGNRSLSVSPDGRFLLVCEEVAKHLTAYETQTGKQLWSIDGQFNSAIATTNGTVYAVLSSGTIYGDRTVIIDQTGHITQRGDAAGFDIVLDPKRDVIWLVGKYIKKCDLQLNLLQEFSPIKWCAVSSDVAPDGSLWVAERQHPDVAQSTNRLIKLSARGEILKSVGLPWSPMSLRVDQTDGSPWVTGIGVDEPFTKPLLKTIEARTGSLPLGKWLRTFLTERRVWYRTERYDSEGALLCRIKRGGASVAIEPADGSLWLAGKDKLYHYSREGSLLATRRGVSSDQKWIVLLPAGN